MAFTPQEFRRTLGRFASGITVVTTVGSDGSYHGITVNSFTSVSLDPPLVLICIDKKTETHSLLPQSGFFCVNILNESQQHLSDRFARRIPAEVNKFDDIPHHLETTGAPVFDQGLGFVDCRVVQAYDSGDHTIFVGEVQTLGSGEADENDPLLYFKSGYRQIKA